MWRNAPTLSSNFYLLSPVNGGVSAAELALLLPVDLRPDGEHHISKHKGIEGDEGDVAAEVEGEHAADEEEEHAAGLVPLQVLPRQDRHPQRHQERFARETQAQRI